MCSRVTPMFLVCVSCIFNCPHLDRCNVTHHSLLACSWFPWFGAGLAINILELTPINILHLSDVYMLTPSLIITAYITTYRVRSKLLDCFEQRLILANTGSS